ncbi:MAG: OmpA family protein [Pseudomonadota bacterium]|nr:OmpA family protein [Pseudomonadota bacterium]MDP2352702.1 OmpA family protein [Pseudomonadota bacterium]
MICALGAMQAQADSGGPMRFVRQAYQAPSDFARVMPAEETLIDVSRAPQRMAAGRTFWISVEKTSRPTLAELDALLNPLAPVSEVIEEACAEGVAAFSFESSRIQQASNLEAVLDQIKQTDNRVVVVGHTDSVGSDAYNCRLGLKRARAAAAWFADHGVARERMAIGSRGKREPLVENQSAAGRAQNRRAAVWLQVNQDLP